MALIAEETLAKSAGNLYVGPLGTGAPAVADLDDDDALALAGWAHVGWLAQDGPSFSGFEGSNRKHYGWNAVQPVRSITRVTEPQVAVPLLQWNVENLETYFPGATYEEGTQTLSIPEAGNPDAQELLVTVHDGDDVLAFWAARTTHRGGGALTFPGDGLAEIPVVFDVLSAGDPSEFAAVIGVEVAGAAPGS